MGGKLIVYAAEEEEYFTFVSPANCTELSASRKEKTLVYAVYGKASAVYGKASAVYGKASAVYGNKLPN